MTTATTTKTTKTTKTPAKPRVSRTKAKAAEMEATKAAMHVDAPNLVSDGAQEFDATNVTLSGVTAQTTDPADAYVLWRGMTDSRQPVPLKVYQVGNARMEVIETPRSEKLGYKLEAMRFLMTNELWSEVMGSCPSTAQLSDADLLAAVGNSDDNGQVRDLPVTDVNFWDCVEAANKMSVMMGLQPAYIIHGQGDDRRLEEVPGANGWVIPTEEEWEFAARAGESYKFAGSDVPSEVAWTSENSGGRIHCVGELKPNAWGCFDFSGNAWEWTSTPYDSNRR